MKLRIAFVALIFSGLTVLIAFPAQLSAQSNAPSASAPKDAGAVSPGNAVSNTNTNPTKHRYWRHRGGKHPHFGSRRVRT